MLVGSGKAAACKAGQLQPELEQAEKGGRTVSQFHGTIHNGQIVLDEPASLPDGTRVEVVPIPSERLTVGMREQDWPTTPEGIAGLLARMDKVEPGWLSPEDDAAWRAGLHADKEREKSQFMKEAETLRGIW